MSKNDSMKWTACFTISRDISPKGFNVEISVNAGMKNSLQKAISFLAEHGLSLLAIVLSIVTFFRVVPIQRTLNAIWRAITQDVCGWTRSNGVLVLISLCMLFVIFLAMLLRSCTRDWQKNCRARENARLDYQKFLMDKAFSVASPAASVSTGKIVITVTSTVQPCVHEERNKTSDQQGAKGASK